MEVHELAVVKPLDKLMCDYMEHGGKNYHVITDMGSGYVWVRETPTRRTQQAVAHLKSVLSMFGCALKVSSDHGPSYREAWSEALAQLGVDVIHGAAYHPQSQGDV